MATELAYGRVVGWGSMTVTPTTVTMKFDAPFILRMKRILEKRRRMSFYRIGEPSRSTLDPIVMEMFLRKILPAMDGVPIRVDWDHFAGLYVNTSQCRPIELPKASLMTYIIEKKKIHFLRHNAGEMQHSGMDAVKAQGLFDKKDQEGLARMVCELIVDGKFMLAHGIAKAVVTKQTRKLWQPMDAFQIERVLDEFQVKTIFGERVYLCSATGSREIEGPIRWAQLTANNRRVALNRISKLFV